MLRSTLVDLPQDPSFDPISSSWPINVKKNVYLIDLSPQSSFFIIIDQRVFRNEFEFHGDLEDS